MVIIATTDRTASNDSDYSIWFNLRRTSQPGEANDTGGTKEKPDNAIYLLNYTV